MNWVLIAGVVVFIGAVFSVLGFWQRSIEAAEEEELARKVKEAEELGANQPLTQHPQIDTNLCLGCGSCVKACHETGVLAVVGGKARLVNASGCVGHGQCEVICPVGAITVGLGDVSQRTDIPQLSDEWETSVPSVFIIGELGGVGLIRNAVAQGTEVAQTIARRLKSNGYNSADRTVLDVLVVGSGPAGIAATLKAHELGLKYELIDQDDLGGAVRKYPRNKMTLTQPVDLPIYGRMKKSQYSKEELLEMWEKIMRDTGIGIRTGTRLTGIERRDDGTLVAKTSAGEFRCRHCVLALGRRGTPRRLDVPGEESERVLYQLVDAAEYRGKNLLVVGGGDSAIEAAIALATQPGNRVTLSYRRQAFFRIKQRNRDHIEAALDEGLVSVVFNSEVNRIESDHVLLSLQNEKGAHLEEATVAADYVFVFAGGEPPYPLLKNIGVAFGTPANNNDGDKIPMRTAG